MPKLLIGCAHPGLIRGGRHHPAFAAHELGAFTRPQLEEMLREPSLSLAVGDMLTLENLDEVALPEPEIEPATTTAKRPAKAR